jgi:hypothetical protein
VRRHGLELELPPEQLRLGDQLLEGVGLWLPALTGIW